MTERISTPGITNENTRKPEAGFAIRRVLAENQTLIAGMYCAKFLLGEDDQVIASVL